MNTVNVIVAFFICTLLSVLYWQIFHTVIVKRLRFQLFALRDECRRFAADNGLGKSKHYRDVERLVCKMIHVGPKISLVSFVIFCFLSRKVKLDDEEIRDFAQNAPKELVQIRDSAAKHALLMMSLNSPFAMFAFAAVAIILLAFGKISRMTVYRGAEQYVNQINESDFKAYSI